MATDNIALGRRIFEEAWNKGDMAAVDQLLADRFIGHAPLVGELRGQAAYKAQVEMYRTAFPDLHVAVDDIGAVGDRVFIRWTGRGTHRGPLMNIPPTNKRGEVRGMTMLRIASGRIAEEYAVFDTFALLQLMNAVPPLDRLASPETQPRV